MRDITLEELLSAGCHFGHQVNRRNPKADDFIFESRSNVHIIDLAKTREGLLAAAGFLKNLASNGGTLVIIGTKRQAKGVVEEEVKRAKEAGAKNLFYTTSRWIGGTLTNFSEVSKNFKKLENISKILANPGSTDYTKRELLLFEREKQKLLTLYGGVALLDKIPDALFIIDTHLERTAVHEAQVVGIDTVGIVDTNADPYEVTYPIPANDDAVGSVKLLVSYLMNAWIEGSDRSEARGDHLQGEAADKGGQKNSESKVQSSELKEKEKKETTKKATSKIEKK